MKHVLILTKTNWNEPPRIRHQVARLFKKNGCQVTFIEKNTYKSFFIKRRKEDGITFFSHCELIHHQLRYLPIIQKLNNLVVQFYLKKICNQIEFDFIVNFNYDYSFLRRIAPDKKIITLINDDFEAQAKFGMQTQIRNQVKKTCKSSDFVLTVSYPLLKKLKSYTEDVQLFLPWSQKKYTSPKVFKQSRNTILYFGYVGRLDWATIESLVSSTKYTYRFIGPTTKDVDTNMIKKLVENFDNFKYVPFSKIEDLKLDDVFCSILPYDSNLESVQACTVSNRAFNLLSLGLPLAYADLKYLIEAPDTIIRKNKNVEDYTKTLELFHTNFYRIQDDIEAFLENHYENNRWKALEKIIND